jgi:hypothetical protein
MKNLLVMLLLGFAIAGCTFSAQRDAGTRSTPNETPAGNPEINGKAPATQDAAKVGSASSLKPGNVTGRPPVVPIGPVQGNPKIPIFTLPPMEGWKTFISPTLGIAVDYPEDWSVFEQADRITFSSPQDLTIVLQMSTSTGAGIEPKNGDQQCTNLINTSGLAADICADGDIYSSDFNVKAADGSIQHLTLSTTRREALDVYKAMVNSLRLVK